MSNSDFEFEMLEEHTSEKVVQQQVSALLCVSDQRASATAEQPIIEAKWTKKQKEPVPERTEDCFEIEQRVDKKEKQEKQVQGMKEQLRKELLATSIEKLLDLLREEAQLTFLFDGAKNSCSDLVENENIVPSWLAADDMFHILRELVILSRSDRARELPSLKQLKSLRQPHEAKDSTCRCVCVVPFAENSPSVNSLHCPLVSISSAMHPFVAQKLTLPLSGLTAAKDFWQTIGETCHLLQRFNNWRSTLFAQPVGLEALCEPKEATCLMEKIEDFCRTFHRRLTCSHLLIQMARPPFQLKSLHTLEIVILSPETDPVQLAHVLHHISEPAPSPKANLSSSRSPTSLPAPSSIHLHSSSSPLVCPSEKKTIPEKMTRLSYGSPDKCIRLGDTLFESEDAASEQNAMSTPVTDRTIPTIQWPSIDVLHVPVKLGSNIYNR